MTRSPKTGTAMLVTCEHGGYRVPGACRRWFADAREALDSHRGFDAGALAMAHTLARTLDADLLVATTSRLVVELNRSLRHPQLFSRYMKAAPEAVRAEVFARYYAPYWCAARAAVARAARRHRGIVHISSHSFTPVLDGKARRADVGLLYDPKRVREAALCARWREAILRRAPRWTVRRNYPYAGASDGLTTALRRAFPASQYVGVELEINQRHPLRGGPAWRAMQTTIAAALAEALATPNEPSEAGPWEHARAAAPPTKRRRSHPAPSAR